MEAGPVSEFNSASTTTHMGDAARTTAVLPFTRTLFASASPLSPAPQIQKRSRTETTGGKETDFGSLAPDAGSIRAAAEAPEAFVKR
jgi:hypothetical protein